LKLGIASYSYHRTIREGKMSIERFIIKAYELGLDGVELNQLFFEPADENVQKIKRLLINLGLDLSCVTVDNNFCVPSLEDRKRQIDWVKKWIDATLKLSAPIMRINAGWPPKEVSEEEAFAWSVECIKDVCRYAENYSLMLTVENHGGITRTADQVLKLIEAVGSEWFRINMDTANFPAETRYIEIEKAAPFSVHVHAKILELGLEWFGLDNYWVEKKLDYKIVMEILRRANYNGYVSLEYEGKEPEETAIPKAVEFLRMIV